MTIPDSIPSLLVETGVWQVYGSLTAASPVSEEEQLQYWRDSFMDFVLFLYFCDFAVRAASLSLVTNQIFCQEMRGFIKDTTNSRNVQMFLACQLVMQ